MITPILLVLLGLVLLVGGGEALLRGAVGLATLARVTPAVIGLTVVAAGTSVPELAVSLLAALRGNEAVAIGNVVGSNIFNVAFILGITALIRPLAILGNTIRLEYPVLAVVTILYLALGYDGSIGRIDGAIFVVIYVAFTAYLVLLVRKQMRAGEERLMRAEVAELTPNEAPNVRGWLSVVLVVVGVGLLVGGAQATISGAVVLGRMLGMSERVIGLTIVAAGTGLPEVVTSLVSSIRGRSDVAVGNVIGSNLFNLLGVLGISGLVRPVSIPSGVIRGDNWWLLGITLLLFPILFTGRKISRAEGALFLATYGVFLGMILASPAGG